MLNKPTILQVLPALGTGGVERGTIDMARAIVEAGGVAIVASADGVWRRHLKRLDVTYINLPLNSKNPFVIWKNHFALARIIRSYHVDIVHARSRAPAWSAWLAAKKCHTCFITTWHGVYHESWFGKRWYNQVMTKGKRVIAISHYIAHRLQEQYGVDQQRLRIVPRGVDLDVFNPYSFLGDRVIALAKKWGVAEEQKVILLPGRLTAWKGHELLLRAFAMVSRTDPTWICVFAGPIKKNDQFVKKLLLLATQLQVRDRIYFVGDCQDMSAAFALSSIVVVPSLKPEPFGRVVVEAQAMEKVVVVANHGGAAETVEDGQTGYVFPPGDAKTLADILQWLMQQNQDDLQWMGRVAREKTSAHYSLQQMQQATLKVCNEVLPSTKQLIVK